MSRRLHNETPHGLTWIHAEGYRTLLDATLQPGSICALVGEANTGKSNLLAAVHTLLDPEAAPLSPDDTSRRSAGHAVIGGRLADGTELSTDRREQADPGKVPAVLFFPASLRSDRLLAPSPHSRSSQSVSIFERALVTAGTSTTRSVISLIAGLEACCEACVTESVLVIEEPELYLTPQTARYLYRLLHRFAACGNQVIYSTHSPALLNVARVEELAVTERHPDMGTLFTQPAPLEADEAIFARSEFDAERSELFVARAVVLVEGMTEKLVLPFVFAALGHDVDRERISVVECGGKGKIPMFVRICEAGRIPSVVVHDRDAPEGEEPILSEQQLNELILETAGAENTVELTPDFEGVVGLRGKRDKVARAWRHFQELSPESVPEPLRRAVERALELARERARRSPVGQDLMPSEQ